MEIGSNNLQNPTVNTHQPKKRKWHRYKAKAPAKTFEKEVENQLITKRQEAQTSLQKNLVDARTDAITKDLCCLYRTGQTGYLSLLGSTPIEEEFPLSSPKQKRISGRVEDRSVEKARVTKKKAILMATRSHKTRKMITVEELVEKPMEKPVEEPVKEPIEVQMEVSMEVPVEVVRIRSGRVVRKKVVFESGRNWICHASLILRWSNRLGRGISKHIVQILKEIQVFYLTERASIYNLCELYFYKCCYYFYITDGASRLVPANFGGEK